MACSNTSLAKRIFSNKELKKIQAEKIVDKHVYYQKKNQKLQFGTVEGSVAIAIKCFTAAQAAIKNPRKK